LKGYSRGNKNMPEYIEINENSQVVRKFDGVENKDEAIEHVLSYNKIYVFPVKSIEDIHGSIDQFMKQLGLTDFIKIGLFEDDNKCKGTGRFEYTCKKCGWIVRTDILPSNGICHDCR